jgi:protease IV
MPVPGLDRPLRRPWVLALDLSRPVIDTPEGHPLARMLAARRPGLRDTLELLEEAARDPRIHAVLARVDAPAGSWAHAEELYRAIEAFRVSGKRAIAHAQSFSEAGDAALAYHVATAFDEIQLQPTGEVGVTGVALVQPFIAGVLDKLDVTPQFDHRHEYKTAKNLLTERKFTNAHRENVEQLAARRYQQLVEAVAAGRRLDPDRVIELIDRAPLSAEDALAGGLVDRLAYRDQTVAAVEEQVGDGARLVTSDRYRSRARRRRWRPRRPTVALIHGHGTILVGRDRRSIAGPVMGADSVVTAFQQAHRDERVRAIVFRVDSPGGSVVASDAVWRAVAHAREGGTPVVVSMGAVAGSGGYWVSAGADRIVASAGTLTGSIGAVYGKFVTRGLRARLGISTDEVHHGANALMMSGDQPFTDEQRDHVGAALDRIYEQFLDRVAVGRGLTREQVHGVARGRVWMGVDAAEHQLVDELGGYREAFVAAARLAGLAPHMRLKVRVLPRRSLAERLGLRAPEAEEASGLLGQLASSVGTLTRGAGPEARMPEWAEVASPVGRGS